MMNAVSLRVFMLLLPMFFMWHSLSLCIILLPTHTRCCLHSQPLPRQACTSGRSLGWMLGFENFLGYAQHAQLILTPCTIPCMLHSHLLAWPCQGCVVEGCLDLPCPAAEQGITQSMLAPHIKRFESLGVLEYPLGALGIMAFWNAVHYPN